ncbi:hypothetical protein AN901_200292 [Pseudomonas syringae pv. theae]|nr:hypothetical protein AN901_200292 [Pseudomonas syringae pv. theae]
MKSNNVLLCLFIALLLLGGCVPHDDRGRRWDNTNYSRDREMARQNEIDRLADRERQRQIEQAKDNDRLRRLESQDDRNRSGW